MELTRYPLAASHFLFGVSNFFVLPLPSTWQLRRGPFDPEVDRRVQRGEISWVQEGRALYLLIHPGYRVTVELHIDIKPHRTSPRLPEAATGWAQGGIAIGGHRAAYVMGEQLRGWWPRRRVRMLQSAFYCDTLGRAISVECIAEGAEADHLQEILQALTLLQCH